MIIGIDGGYNNTKYVTDGYRNMFTSVISEDVLGFNKSLQVIYNNKTYTVGTTGSFVANSNKIEDETFKICMFAAIADSMKDSVDYSVKLITGLPIAYYSKQKTALKESLLDEIVHMTITRNNKSDSKIFRISDVVVFPQSAGVLLTRPELFVGSGYVIVIDIGGFTTDISLFKGKELVRYRTLQKGMLKLNGVLRNYLSSQGIDMSIFEVRELINSSENVGGFIDRAVVSDTCQKYVDSIINDILIEFSEYKYANKVFIGGGSSDLKQYLNQKIMDDCIYVNAEAFYKLGNVK
ncbi:ParM/StbA family protein [Clostridium tertium]|uniref:ParM/StbA family protein n=1 Tax=Clostridium tertium TaxID=1559 RepID=UPI0023B2A6E2|nr:ParM/StbA family protein [Clostridium tertium]